MPSTLHSLIVRFERQRQFKNKYSLIAMRKYNQISHLSLSVRNVKDAAASGARAVSPPHAVQGAALPARRARAHQAALLLLLPHIHGHRSGPGESSASEGDIRVDSETLPVLQTCAAGLEE